MFEALAVRIERRAERLSRAGADATARRMAERMPPGISVTVVDGGVQLAGAGLARRWILDPALRDAIREGLR